MPQRRAETSLYPAVKTHLEHLGYEVKGEICGCDIVAVRPGEPPWLVITELKMGYTLELVLQAVDRFAAADEVWLAVRSLQRGRDRDRRVYKLCRLLGFGLLAVHPIRHLVEVLAEPTAYRPRPNRKRRCLLLREHSRRRGDPTQGGASRTPIMTAYRQQALACAAMLAPGPRKVRELTPDYPDAQKILHRNVYGWFLSAVRGTYSLTDAGHAALKRWPQPVREITAPPEMPKS
jgi:hypothetical protein